MTRRRPDSELTIEKAKQETMSKSPLPDDRIPVIVGVGEIVDRPKEITEGLEPLSLAGRGAQARGSGQRRPAAERDRIARHRQFPELALPRSREAARDAPRHPAEACLLRTGRRREPDPLSARGGAAHRARRMQRRRGLRRRGAESTATKAERAGITLPWTPFAHDVAEPKRGAAFQKPMAVKLGVFRPVTVYPFYEAATAAHWGQTPREAMAESGALWSAYSKVASENPNAWLKRRFTPEEITTPTPDNRLIAWPYTKLMVANPTVNMGGAVLMTSLAKARAAGIPEDRLVHVRGGASAEEPRDYLERDQFFESHAQNAVLKAVMELAGGDGRAFDAIELYSCFPCVPKMARRTLGLGPDVQPTVTGGSHLLRRAAQHLHDACGLRDGAEAARRRQARPALRPGRLRHQASRAGAVAAGAAGAARPGNQRAERGRSPSRRGAGFRHRGQRQRFGREFYRDLWPQQRDRTRRGDAADIRTMRARWRGCRPTIARRWRIF